MTIDELITQVDAIKPNAFTNAVKTAWISRLEGMLQTNCYLMPIGTVITYDYDNDKNNTLLVPPPFDKLYESWLCAMLDYMTGEYRKYANTMEMYNRDRSDFVCWLTDRYEPTKRFFRGELGSIGCGETSVLLETLPEGAYLYFVCCGVTEAFDSGTGDTLKLGTDTDDDLLLRVNGQEIGITNKIVFLTGAKEIHATLVSEGGAATQGSATFYAHYFWLEPRQG
jgi:hypothetical protein